MSLLRSIFVAFFVAVVLTSCSQMGRVSSGDKLAYKAPVPDEWTLPNGLTVLYYKDDELPLVSGTLLMKGGELWESKDVPGVVNAMGNQMREGGAGELSPQRVDAILESLAASIGSDFGDERGSVSFSCLSSDFEQVFDIFSKVVLEPRFDQDRFNLWKGNHLEAIRRRKDDPQTIATIAFRELLYGDTPYGVVLTSKQVKKLSRLDLLRAHRKFVRPNDAIFVVSGSIERDVIKSAIQNHFAAWDRRAEDLPEPPAITKEPRPGIYFLEFPFEQSTIYMGQLGVPRLTEDYPSIDIFNRIFGSGSMSTRLMRVVRGDLGLAYGVSGAISPAVVKGQNWIYLQTKAVTTGEALEASLKTLQQLQKELVDEEELAETKAAIQNSFIFRFDSPFKAVYRRALIKMLEYPEDYDETYIPLTSQASAQDILEVAQKRWDLEKFVVVVVGNNTAYLSLKKLLEDSPNLLPSGRLIKASFNERVRL